MSLMIPGLGPRGDRMNESREPGGPGGPIEPIGSQEFIKPAEPIGPPEPVEPTASAIDPETLREYHFASVMAAAPAPIVTYSLIGLNIVVYAAMVMKGVGIMDPSAEALVDWGANFGPLTLKGQWWRLLTCTFIHIGLIHILMNMFVLQGVGGFVEKLFGRLSYLTLYILSGLGGSLLSVWIDPSRISAGASGAVFGVYGGLVGFLVAQRKTVPTANVKALANGAFAFVGYNTLIGMTAQSIDMAAHFGGLGAGLAVGLALAQPLPAAWRPQLIRCAVVLVATLGIGGWAARKNLAVDDLKAEIQHFAVEEKRVTALFNDAFDKWQKNEMTGEQFSRIVETQFIPPYQEELARMGQMTLVLNERRMRDRVKDYIEKTVAASKLLAQGARANNQPTIQRAMDQMRIVQEGTVP